MSLHEFNIEEGKSPLKVLRELIGQAEGKDSPISQQDFATRLGAAVVSISRWERGQTVTLTFAQFKRLKKLVESVGWSIDDLPDNLGPAK
jgi:transcriptional regulator with XRE-family HTH domain